MVFLRSELSEQLEEAAANEEHLEMKLKRLELQADDKQRAKEVGVCQVSCAIARTKRSRVGRATP